jgi:myosin heavy subunit
MLVSLCCSPLRRYGVLSKEVWQKQVKGDAKSICGTLVRQIGWSDNKEFCLGKTKIFIQDAATLYILEDLVDRKINESVVNTQKAWRKYK